MLQSEVAAPSKLWTLRNGLNQCIAAVSATLSLTFLILIRAFRSGQRHLMPSKNSFLKLAATSTADSASQSLRYESFCRRPTTKRPPKNACTLTLRPTTLKPKLAALKRLAPPGGIIRWSADSTFGYCTTHGETSSVCFSRSFPSCWRGGNHGISKPCFSTLIAVPYSEFCQSMQVLQLRDAYWFMKSSVLIISCRSCCLSISITSTSIIPESRRLPSWKKSL